MGQKIDEKVVEMRFDNKQFEAGASQTINTLQKLKQSLRLNEAAKGFESLDKAANSVRLKGISEGVEKLQKRFSVMGIASMRVIENVTDSLMGLANRGFAYVEQKIVSGGIRRAMNIENAHFSLQSLLKDEQKVQAIMADANASVDGTAYSYDEAAKAAASFAATGLEAGEEMLGALKAIAGTAAMTNSDYASMSQIFTTVAGQGRLMGDQLLQLSSRGMNAAATIADYFREVKGQANMTEGAIREMVTKGQIDFKLFAEAMSWAFGESAERANETFTGAMSNVGAAFARIGAGFVSPFIEQNGELVELLNAVRIKVNEVKSVLVFDEQKNAMRGMVEEAQLMDEIYSQFALTAGDGLDGILRKIVEVNGKEAGAFDKRFEKMQTMWKEMTDNGKVAIEQVKDMDTWGFRTTNGLREYFQGVADGSIEASDQMVETVQNMTKGITVLNSDVDKWLSEGLISMDMFSAAFAHANRDAIKEAGGLETALTGMFSEVKKEGKLTSDTMDKFTANGLDASKALHDYMIGVSKGEIRASYATRQAIEEMAKETSFAEVNLRKLADEGKITSDIFVSAMSNAYGDGEFMSKKFTDYFLDKISQIKEALQNFNASEFAEGLSYIFESIFNVGTAIISYIEPILKAFGNVFTSGKGFNDLAAGIENFTARLKLSERGSKDLEDTFTGLLSIVSLLVDGLFKIIGLFVKVEAPVEASGKGILGLTGYIGRLLTAFSKTVRESKLLKKAFNGLSDAVKVLKKFFKDSGIAVGNFVYKVKSSDILWTILNRLGIMFYNLGKSIKNGLSEGVSMLNNFRKKLIDLIPRSWRDKFQEVINMFKSIGHINADGTFVSIGDVFKSFRDMFKDTKFSDIIKGLGKFKENLEKSFNLEKAFKLIDKAKEKIGKFTDWFSEKILPILSGASIGGILGASGGIALIYIFWKVSQALTLLSNSVASIPKSFASTLDSLRGVFVAYQRTLEADALLKIAKAFGILAISIGALSLLPTGKVLGAAFALAAVASVMLYGFYQIKKVINTGKKLVKPLDNFINSIDKLFTKLGKAANKMATAKLIRSFGESILLIAGSIIAIGLMYKKNPDGMKYAMEAVSDIALVLEIMTILNVVLANASASFSGNAGSNAMNAMADNMKSIGIVLVASAAALAILNNIKLTPDFDTKLGILVSLVAAMGTLAFVLNDSARVFPNDSKIASLLNPMISMAIMLGVTVKSLETLMNMPLPLDWMDRCIVLGALIGEIGLIAKKLNETGIYLPENTTQNKIFSSMLGMSAMLYISVLSLEKLMSMPLGNDWGIKFLMLVAIIGLVAYVATALGDAGGAAGGAIKAGGAILALSVLLLSITGTLFLISKIPDGPLIKATAMLILVMLGLGKVFSSIAMINTAGVAASVLSISAVLISLTVALGVLSLIRGDLLAQAVGALATTLVVLAGVFTVIGKMQVNNAWVSILAMSGMVVVLAGALFALSSKSWDSLAAAAGALAAGALSIAGALWIIGSKEIPVNNIIAFVVAAGSLLLIGESLKNLIGLDVGELIGSALALAIGCIGVAGAMAIIGSTQINLVGIFSFVAGAVALIPAAYALQIVSEIPFTSLIKGLGGLAAAMVIIGVGGSLLGTAAPAIILGAVALTAFSVAILALGVSLGVFSESLVFVLENVAKMPDLIVKIGQEMFKAGQHIMAGLIAGIKSGVEGVFNLIKSVGEGIVNFFKKIFKIQSPSKIMEQIGGFLDMGLAGGIVKNQVLVDSASENMANSVVDKTNITDEMVQNGTSAGQGWLNGLGSLGPDMDSMIQQFVNSGTGNLDFSNYFAAGNEAGANAVNGLQETKGAMHDGFAQYMRDSTLSTTTDAFTQTGEQAGEATYRGLGFGMEDMDAYMQDLMNQTAGGMDLNSYLNLGDSSGSNIMSGIQNSLNGNLSGVLNEQMSSAVSGIDTTTMFGNVGSMAVNDMVSGYSSEINAQASTVGNVTASSLQQEILKSMSSGRTNFSMEGKEEALLYIKGFVYHYLTGKATGTMLASKILEGLKVKRVDKSFYNEGVSSAMEYIRGIRSKYQEAIGTGDMLAKKVIEGLKSLYVMTQFKQAGENAGKGYVDGVKSKEEDAKKAGEALGKASSEATKKALNEKSPSRVMRTIGSFGGEGFVLGLLDWVHRASRTGEEFGIRTADGIQLGIQNIHTLLEDLGDPVIKPVMDLSDLKSSTKNIAKMFNDAVYHTSLNVNAAAVSMNVKGKATQSDQNGSGTGGYTYNNYTFNQTNNSPKALSRIDIYRDTRNQISQFKEATKKK